MLRSQNFINKMNISVTKDLYCYNRQCNIVWSLQFLFSFKFLLSQTTDTFKVNFLGRETILCDISSLGVPSTLK